MRSKQKKKKAMTETPTHRLTELEIKFGGQSTKDVGEINITISASTQIKLNKITNHFPFETRMGSSMTQHLNLCSTLEP